MSSRNTFNSVNSINNDSDDVSSNGCLEHSIGRSATPVTPALFPGTAASAVTRTAPSSGASAGYISESPSAPSAAVGEGHGNGGSFYIKIDVNSSSSGKGNSNNSSIKQNPSGDAFNGSASFVTKSEECPATLERLPLLVHGTNASAVFLPSSEASSKGPTVGYNIPNPASSPGGPNAVNYHLPVGEPNKGAPSGQDPSKTKGLANEFNGPSSSSSPEHAHGRPHHPAEEMDLESARLTAEPFEISSPSAEHHLPSAPAAPSRFSRALRRAAGAVGAPFARLFACLPPAIRLPLAAAGAWILCAVTTAFQYLKRAWAWYESRLETYPVATQMANTAALWGLGDILAQSIVEGRRIRFSYPETATSSPGAEEDATALSPRRFLLTANYGALFIAPSCHFWLIFLDRLFRHPLLMRLPLLPRLIVKALFDVSVMGTIFVLAFFLWGALFIDETGFPGFAKVVRESLVPSLMAELMFWPAVQVINFGCVPLHHQLLATNCMSLIDATFLSWARTHGNWLHGGNSG